MDNSLNKARKKRMIKYAVQFQQVVPSELLPHLECLPEPRKERIKCEQKNHGDIAAANELGMTLVKCDNWFEQLIPALRELGMAELADLLDDPKADGLENHKNASHQTGAASAHLERNPCKSQAMPTPSGRRASSRVTLQTPYSQLTARILHEVRALDMPSPAHGSDWKGLAGQLGFTTDAVGRLESQSGSPTEALLSEWGKESDATLGKLMETLCAIQREDLSQKLEELLHIHFEARGGNQIDNNVEVEPTASVSTTEVSTHVPHQLRNQPPAMLDNRAGPSVMPETSNATSMGLSGNTGAEAVTEPEDPLGGQQPSTVASHAGESRSEGTTGMSMHEAEMESNAHHKSQNSFTEITKSKADKFEQDIRPENQDNTADRKWANGQICEAPGARVRETNSEMPVNDLNRIHHESNPTQGKVLLSTDPETCSVNNPGNSGTYWPLSPDAGYSPLCTDKSLDESVSLQMSDSSVPTNVPPTSTVGATVGASTLVTSDDVTSSTSSSSRDVSSDASSSSPSLSTTASPSVVKPATRETGESHASCRDVATIQISSQGAPVQQPTGPSSYLPEQFQIPSGDGAFSEDALIRASTGQALFKATSQEAASIRTQQDSLGNQPPASTQLQPNEAETAPDRVSMETVHPVHKHQQRRGKAHQEPSPLAEDRKDHDQASPASRPKEGDLEANSQPSGILKREEAGGQPQCIPPLFEQPPCTTGIPSADQLSSDQSTKKEDVSTDSPQASGTRSLEASGLRTLNEEASPDLVNALPNGSGRESPEAGAGNVNTGVENAAAEPRARGAVRGVVLAMPVVLSLAAAVIKGGDFFSNAF
ncbi:uncharacterized protein LOC110981270 [Acanthaster planci]|uniref:Uncharacterized protein LOC110981270 n=1 Tax=Acanthaster planci TaxID=133434 RepID=A0A8B7YPK8_ACAPL|nr:uncharacterized protein LOC110981270 [Acanthaster planci]XP_022094385.1 uncharacterized protein LOC110981270 [Acanthaster planci]XP_022094386.1 uncharacterized protein LOC110981270 [Acanthaster planci]XP_022094387.1 uncharacterized protein LOC110981270 [Acanthaster planci]